MFLQQLGGSLYQSITNFNNSGLPTFEDIYTILLNNDLSKLTPSRLGAYNGAFKRLYSLHEKHINTITLFDMQECVDKSRLEVGSKVLFDMKTICVKIFEYAIIHQYIKRDQDFTSYLNVSKKEIKEAKHKPFTLEEINLLASENSIESKMCLVYIFTGCRALELFKVDEKNIFIDIKDNDKLISYFITGSKTEAGKDQIIPIHNFIKPYLVKVIKNIKRFETPASFRSKCFYPYVDKLGLAHTPYDTRYTFATLAKLYSVDDFCRKRIMGHKAQYLTDDVYTHTFKFKLFEEINKTKIQ